METLETVDRISKQLTQDARPHAFLVGQLNHWIAIVSNRLPTESPIGRSTHVETILLDSRNDFVLNMSTDEISQRVDKRIRKEFPSTRTMWQEICIHLYQQSLLDTQYSCSMFHQLTLDCASSVILEDHSNAIGNTEEQIPPTKRRSTRIGNSRQTATKKKVSEPHKITTNLILLFVQGFLEAYQKHVGDQIITNVMTVEHPPAHVQDISSWLFNFVMWVQEYSPLRSIEDNFILSLRRAKKCGYNIPLVVPEALETWVQTLQARISQARDEAQIDEVADGIIADLIDNTIPIVLTACKYLRK